jgi:predicted XRE-type DNA-binding protein
MEIWKKIEGFENYEVSNYGRLKVNLKFRKYRNYQSKFLNPSKDKDGYFRTALTKDNKKFMKTIHRLVAESFIKNTENKPCVNHINGVKTDNRIENLEWCTIKENNIHAIKLGLSFQHGGEKHHMSKLKENQVLEIIQNKNNLTQKQLSEFYGISQTQISRIINKKRWHVRKQDPNENQKEVRSRRLACR